MRMIQYIHIRSIIDSSNQLSKIDKIYMYKIYIPITIPQLQSSFTTQQHSHKIYLYQIQSPEMTFPMHSHLHNKIQQLTSYMRPLLMEGVDITGLYIVDAHLTSFKGIAKPISILMSLFSHNELSKMLALTHKRVNQLKEIYGSYKANGRQTEVNDIQRFKVSVKDFNKKPLEDLTVLAKQLLETLQEWDIIQTKTQRFRASLEKQNINSCQTYSPEQLKKQLEMQLQLLVLYNNEKQFKITQSTECFSSFQELQVPVNLKKLGQADVSMIFEYIVRWSNEVYHEIEDFKATIEITKDQSSVDLQPEPFMFRATDFTSMSLKTRGKQNKFISNADNKTKASTKLRPSKQNLRVSFEINSVSSEYDKLNRQLRPKDYSSKLSSDFSLQIGRRAQLRVKANEKECCKCQIF